MTVISDEALEAGREPVKHSKRACHTFSILLKSFELQHQVIT